jgi:hypothetical protein
MGNKA